MTRQPPLESSPRPRGPWTKASRVAATAYVAGLGLVLCAGAQEIEVRVKPTRWRLHTESLRAKEKDGETRRGWMLGLFYDWLDGLPQLPGSYLGFGGFGAVEGDLGGALYAGLTAGWRRELSKNYGLDVGLFLGAGGGGEADWGSGLVVRPHLAIERLISNGAALRLELSHVETPDGDVESTQLGIGLTDFDELLTADWSLGELLPIETIDSAESRSGLNLGLRVMLPSSGSKNLDGGPLRARIGLASLHYERPAGGSWYVPIEVATAFSGQASGFVQALVGLGARFVVAPKALLGRFETLVGPAGGGNVDTGGGFYAESRLGLEAIANDDWRLALLGGYGVAPDGNFDGWTITGAARFAPRPVELRPGQDARGQGLFDEAVDLETWQIDVLHRFLGPDGKAKANGMPIDKTPQLLGVGAERRLTPSWGVSLRAFGAYAGESAGYREGQLGMRYHLQTLELLDDPGDFFLQYHLGAGGGGGIENGSGLMQSIGAGYSFIPTPGLRLGIEAAAFRSFEDKWSGQAITLSVSYDLTRPIRAR